MENPPMEEIESAILSTYRYQQQLQRNPDSGHSTVSSRYPHASTSRLPSKRFHGDTHQAYSSESETHRKPGSKLGQMWENLLSSTPFSATSEPQMSQSGLASGSGSSSVRPPLGDDLLPLEPMSSSSPPKPTLSRANIVTSYPMPLHSNSNRSTASFETSGFSLVFPPSPTAILDFNAMSLSANGELPKCGLFSSPARHGLPPRANNTGSTRRFLPRLFGSLGTPSRDRRSKGKGKLHDQSDSLDFDDEACFVDIKETSGMDIITQLPYEIALYILIHLDLPAVIACLAVSRYWRMLALDPLIWRELFIRQGWTINSAVAAHQLRNGVRHVAPTIPIPPSPSSAISVRRLSFSFSRHSGGAGSNANLSHRASVISSQPSNDGASSIAHVRPGEVPPLSLDWIGLYKVRQEIDHRWKTAEPKVTHFSGHEDSVYCLEFDGDKIITGSRDRTIKVWSLKTGELRSTLHGHGGSVLCLKFDHTGFMVSGSSDRSIFVWDLHTSTVKNVLRGHSGGVLDLRIDANWIVSCSKDAIIRVWSRQTLEMYCALQGHEGPVNAVGLQDDKVVSASGDGKMMLWDLTTKTRLRTFEGHDRGLACIDFKGDHIISGSNDRKIKVWSASTGECLQTLAGHDLLVRALAFDPLLGKLVSASYDKTVKVWDLATGKCVRDFKDFHTSHIFDVKFDATRIVSSSHDEKIVVLDFGSDLDTSLFT